MQFRHILSATEAITCCSKNVAITVEVDGKEERVEKFSKSAYILRNSPFVVSS